LLLGVRAFLRLYGECIVESRVDLRVKTPLIGGGDFVPEIFEVKGFLFDEFN
jgi:hypothetical protein